MICWIDAAAGASGDMFLGALADAGVPVPVLQRAVDALGTEPVRLRADETTRHGLAAIKMDVDCPPSTVDRRYTAIVELIEAAELPRPVKDAAIETFTRLGRAEAAAHRVPLAQVHFHEVGALDSLADVVATCAGLHWLAANRGVTAIVCSPVTAGGGVTRGAHGGIPLPAPATLAVLAEAKAPVAGEVPYEACTPTGAALIAAHATDYGLLPPMTVAAIGVGAGGRDPKERANVLRLVLGRPVTARPSRVATVGGHGHEHGPGHGHGHEHAHGHEADPAHGPVPGREDGPAHGHGHGAEHDNAPGSGSAHGHEADPAHGPVPGHEDAPAHQLGPEADPAHGPVPGHEDAPTQQPGHHPDPPDEPRAVVMSANIDDLDPRLWPQVLAALLESGASDAWLTPILMKKGRPAHTLSVLCRTDIAATVRTAIFAHTSTIGLRISEVGKHALDREYGSIHVDGHDIGVKLARDAGRIVNVSVEHRDVVAAATALDLPVKVMLARALGSAAEKYGTE